MHRRSLSAVFGVLLFGLVGSCTPGKHGDSCAEGEECDKGLVCGGGSCSRCVDTPDCKEKGRCSHFLGKCIATTESCQRSKRCETEHECTLLHDVCVSQLMIPRKPQDSNNQEGGCPCGCDHSVEMLAELQAGELPASLESARESLRVIAEREHVGYITEAMVSHRLRLRAFEREHARDAAAVWAVTRAAAALRDARATTPIATLGELHVRRELAVFGRTVETVRGREKELEPCFRLWLQLENTSDESITLARPSLEGSVGFDVRRWYLEGGDGDPWDGVIPGGEARSVLMIGYVTDAIDPGIRVDARIMFGSATLLETSMALGSWDARLEPSAME